MPTYENFRDLIRALVEADYAAATPSEQEKLKATLSSLGDPGVAPPYDVVTFGSGVSEFKILEGSAIGPASDSSDPENSGPDPVLVDKTSLAYIIRGVAEWIDTNWKDPLNRVIDEVNAQHAPVPPIPNIL